MQICSSLFNLYRKPMKCKCFVNFRSKTKRSIFQIKLHLNSHLICDVNATPEFCTDIIDVHYTPLD